MQRKKGKTQTVKSTKAKRQSKKKFTMAQCLEASKKYSNIASYLSSKIYGRKDEIRALLYAISARKNLMLDGKHGLGKSLLAQEFFNCLGDSFKTFQVQLHTSIDPESVIGAFDLKTYQEEAVYRYNTESFLPTAHFAYLDEVYRASGKFLPTLMSILNERKFKNGTELQDCPLITAIGTTNFVSDDSDLEAFHDRWLIHVDVQPIDIGERKAMFKTAIDPEHVEVDPFEMEDLEALFYLFDHITIQDSFLDIYTRFIRVVQSSVLKGQYISDRRLIDVLQLMKISYFSDLIADDDVDESELDFDSEFLDMTDSAWALSALVDSRIGLFPVGNAELTTKFETCYQDFIADISK